MARPIVIFVILIPLWIATEPATARSGEAQPRYDGGWWQTASSDERTGFLYALDDCLAFDEKPALWFDDTWSHYEQEITQYYSFSVLRRGSSVESIFTRFGKKQPGIAASDASARYGDEFWRAHSESVHRGFVEGYFACRDCAQVPRRFGGLSAIACDRQLRMADGRVF